MHGRQRTALACVLVPALALALAFGAGAARAADAEELPSPELLEFLGTWTAEDDGGDWAGLLDGVLRDEDRPPEPADAEDDDASR